MKGIFLYTIKYLQIEHVLHRGVVVVEHRVGVFGAGVIVIVGTMRDP